VEKVRNPQVLIIGIGNPYRGDDAAGLLAARRLKEMQLDSATIMEHSGEGTSLLETWKGAQAVILIDAVSSRAVPGTIHRLEPISNPLPTEMFHTSTHAFSLPDAIELARALNELPPALQVFGIEGRNFQAGSEISREVRDAITEVARMVANEVNARQSAPQ
jgi:hydrogenase maturation protease